MDIKAQVNKKWLQFSEDAKQVSRRVLDLDINLAVTGLSGAGKTAFISALTQHVRFASQTAAYPFWQAAEAERIIGCKRNLHDDNHTARFRLDDAMACLTAEAPVWPKSTKGISSLSLTLKFKPEHKLKSLLTDALNLRINITDYPGEWLLDLPMLKYDYQQWSDSIWQRYRSHTDFYAFKQACENQDWHAPADELVLEKLAAIYTEFLHKIANESYSYVQPGRFVLPAEWQGKPALHFVPISSEFVNNRKADETDDVLFSLNKSRFEFYVKEIVTPFYHRYFNDFDRQVVLVDVLKALNGGDEKYQDLKFTLAALSESFEYGKQNWLSHIISPKIDKVLFAVTKADHITPEQRQNAVSLLKTLAIKSEEHLKYSHVDTHYLAIASIAASKAEKIMHEGQQWSVLNAIELHTQTPLCFFPGEVPAVINHSSVWSDNQFNFKSFSPPLLLNEDAPFPHIAMDKVCEFLFGDKMQ
ncbi:YcjX family protein [Algibacillus agarilyticus]|uniref:YcjX family protein n=1 Tax=Algibacillus agarilyticus TaxID=2234133 RepID=UPI000DCF82EF|nr:YcjX family protein [Algibacillus agarilyticus]